MIINGHEFIELPGNHYGYLTNGAIWYSSQSRNSYSREGFVKLEHLRAVRVCDEQDNA